MSLFEFEFPITLGISEKFLPLIGRGLNSGYRQNQGPEQRIDEFPSPDVQPGTVGNQKLSMLYWCSFQHYFFSLFPDLPFVLEVVLFVTLRRIRAEFWPTLGLASHCISFPKAKILRFQCRLVSLLQDLVPLPFEVFSCFKHRNVRPNWLLNRQEVRYRR